LELAYLLIVLFVLALVFAPIVLALVAFVRTQRIVELVRRVDRLERAVRELRQASVEPAIGPEPAPPPAVSAEPAPLVELAPILEPAPIARPASVAAVSRPSPAPAPAPAPLAGFDWEWFIGRKALGWVAVVLIVFATAFFLRYAFENNWIGPIGRVALASLGGLGLVAAGWHYDRNRGWRRFAQMLSGAGVVLLYLAAYSAFGFYHLLPQSAAGPYLIVLVVETMMLAAAYDAPALALVAVLGGLITPVLLPSEVDRYTALFLYLGVFNAGVVLLGLWRPWPVVTTAALLGTQLLFWAWYGRNYHPEKLGASLAFLAAVFLLHLIQVLALAVRGRPSRPWWVRWEELGRWLINASLGFAGVYVLLNPDHAPWMGTLAALMAVVYAELARWLLARAERARGGDLAADEGLYLTTMAIAAGFVAAVFPIQADAPWIALGWAAEAGVLWWFGLRVSRDLLRGLAAALAVLATTRIVGFDLLHQPEQTTVPFFNTHTLPALAASACLLAALEATRRLLQQRTVSEAERTLATAAEVGGVLLLWLVMSVDLNAYCRTVMAASTPGDDRLAQMALSVFWAVFASAVLAVGFRLRRARLRWTALGLYGLTVAKVFLFDMSGLDEIYRILAFFVLAILLGVAAAVYQRLRPDRDKGEPVPGPVPVELET
jgi:uncharacterized membrane protein